MQEFATKKVPVYIHYICMHLSLLVYCERVLIRLFFAVTTNKRKTRAKFSSLSEFEHDNYRDNNEVKLFMLSDIQVGMNESVVCTQVL